MTDPAPDQVAPQQADRHDPVYDELAARPEFADLRRAYRGFVFPATAAFLVWYLLYVVLSNWAGGFMGHRLFGNINVALVLGVLQFVTTFLLAWLYARYSARRLDPLALEIQEEYDAAQAGPATGRDGAR